MKRFLCAALLMLGLVSSSAFAQPVSGVVTAYVDLYAGPDIGYPTIAQIPAGTGVSIQGCLAGWTWCDVSVMGMRGWVAGTYVQYIYQSQPVIVADYGARIGIPIVAFSIGAYWGNYYSNRPFYRNRDYWFSRPFVPRPPPRPPVHRPGYRPPGPGYRPPAPGYRPPSQGHRPPNQGNRPHPGTRPPGNGQRPPNQGGNRPPSQGNRPPGSGQRPPAQGGQQRPQTKPAQANGDNKP